MSEQETKSECWCYALKRTVQIRGVIGGRRQADLLRIKHCELESMCAFKGSVDCLLGKLCEGRW